MNHKADGITRAIATPLRAGCTLLSLALIVGGIVAGAAWAAVKPDDIAGRWELRGGHCAAGACKALYDFSPCGKGWCGVEVGDGGKCGQTSIQLVAENRSSDTAAVFSGQFRPVKDADPYVIEAYVTIQKSGERNLRVFGHTGGEFQGWRRIYPVEMGLERVGEPECRGEPRTS